MKRILITGATGAMGTYLVPELLNMGYRVDAVSLDDMISSDPNLKYIKADAKNEEVIKELLKNDYDGVVDFMIYPEAGEIEKFTKMYLENTGHYIFLSSYRIYANKEHPVKETSPRLLEASDDKVFLESNDYAIYKAKGEDFVRNSGHENYTIIRPAITYSKRRFQLVTMEMNLVIRRMIEGKTLVLPEAAMNVEATMSWAGDVAKMISRLLLNKDAFKETYSVCTAQHQPWREVAQIYQKIGGLKYCTTDTDTFLDIIAPGSIYARQQLLYDRCFDRIMDNSKILNITGMKQSELMPLEKGLALEFNNFPKNFIWNPDDAYNRMDKFLNE